MSRPTDRITLQERQNLRSIMTIITARSFLTRQEYADIMTVIYGANERLEREGRTCKPPLNPHIVKAKKMSKVPGVFCLNTNCKHYFEDNCFKFYQESSVEIGENGQCESFEQGVCELYGEEVKHEKE